MRKIIQLLTIIITSLFICACSNVNSSSSQSTNNSSESTTILPITSTISVTQTEKVIMLEKFTADWCAPCLTAANNFETLNQNGLNSYAIMVNYNDDHILDSLDSNTQSFIYSNRTYRYDNAYYPTLYIDGSISEYWAGSITIDNIIGTDEDNYTAETADYSISISISSYNCTIKIQNTSNQTYDNLTAHTLIVEDSYTYASAPGSNNQTTFSHPMILYLGKSYVDAYAPSNSQEIIYNLENYSLPVIYWNYGENSRTITSGISMIVFIQDEDDDSIIQAAKLSMY